MEPSILRNMKPTFTALLALVFSIGCGTPQVVLDKQIEEAPKAVKTLSWKDARVEEYEGRLVLANEQIQLEFSKGNWIGLKSTSFGLDLSPSAQVQPKTS